jgi:hypothetical protein
LHFLWENEVIEQLSILKEAVMTVNISKFLLLSSGTISFIIGVVDKIFG